MIRRLTAVALMALLQIGATSALLVHVHADDDAADHQDRPSHAHLAGRDAASHGAVIDHEDDGRAMAPQVFVAVAADPFAAPAAVLPTFTLALPLEHPFARVPQVTHAHDPPCGSSLSSRAPPAFLS